MALSVFVLFNIVALSRCFGAPSQYTDRLPNLDKRTAAGARTAEQHAALAHLHTLFPDARVEFDPVSGSPKSISSPSGFLSSSASSSSLDPYAPTRSFLTSHRALFGYGPESLDAANIKREFSTPHNGLKTVVWEQQVDNVPIFEAVLISHTTRRGELVNISSQFLSDPSASANRGVTNRATLVRSPTISARQALTLAVENIGENLADNSITAEQGIAASTPEKRQKFRAPSLKGSAETALVWLPMSKDRLRLCWDVIFMSRARGEMFRTLVDVETGEALVRRCLTDYISDASYRVFTSDSPTPMSPGTATPTTIQPPQVARTLLTLSALNTNASPNGWIDDGVNETIGNNVDAHTDINADNQPDLPRPQGSPFRTFDFILDLTQDPSTYSAASVVQLFYLCNWYHDKLYELGFTEAAGNFQSNNFSRGGIGGDAVQADAQDGSGYNNANFSTPPEGSPGRMQMYIFTGPSPRRDGDLDAEVVFHEHTHGLSNRRVGGGVGISALQSAGMGEGWSDFYSLALLSAPEDDVNGNYAEGAYASYLLGSTLQQNYYFGIRRYPYTTDMTRNPLTLKDIDPTQASSHPGVPTNAVVGGGVASEVHNQGEIWCVTLWDARANLINKYGWAAGNHLILQLVTDGMNLSPPNPTFIQARDGILQADLVANGGANLTELWAAFAKRGLGFSATAPASTTTTGVQEAFDVPDSLHVTPVMGFISSGPVGGPFNSNSMAFALTNTGPASLPWSVISTSSWLSISPLGGTLVPAGPAAIVSASVNSSATNLPMGIFYATIWFSNVTTRAVQTRQFTLRVGQPDYFSELFDSTLNDLSFQSLTFTPDGSNGFYSLCRNPVTEFLCDPAGGTNVALFDDSFVKITLSGTNTVALYGIRTNTFFIGSNGYLTLGNGDNNYLESFAAHFNQPRISALFHDLNPAAGGTISWKQLSDRVAVTFQNVPRYGFSAANNFQVELFFDGRIRLTWLMLNCLNNLVGLSAGQGVPAAFLESDFDAAVSCFPPLPLALSVPANATEGSGLLPSAGTVSIPFALSTNLVVALSSSDPSKVTVPPAATILAGQTNVGFNITIVDDNDLNGPQTAIITASAPWFSSTNSNIVVADNETAILSLSFPGSVTEGQSFQGTVKSSAAATADILVSFASSDSNRLSVPPSVILPAGQTSVVFSVTVADNFAIEGPRTASVTAHVPNWTDASASLIILDDDAPTNGVFATLGTIAIPNQGQATPYPSTLTVAGMWGTITKITVTLSNIWHTYPRDIDILLVGPSGTNVILMASVGYYFGLSGVTLTLDDSAATNLPDSAAILPGTYRPTSYKTIGNSWTAPAPGPPWGTALSGFNGSNPNGIWKLFVYDDAGGDHGAISNGWRIAFTTTGPIAPTIQQTVLTAGQFQFKFQTVTGHPYFVEYKTNLTDPVWFSLQTVLGDGSIKSISDPATSRQRFYRIRLQ